MLERRIRQHGTGYTYYWYISAAFAFLQSVLVPSERVRLKEEAIKRVTEQYCRVLESQEDINAARDIIMPMGLKNVSYGPSIKTLETTDVPQLSYNFL